MDIEFEIKELDKRMVITDNLKTHCTCWGPWFKH